VDPRRYIAVDLGAESGRVMLGTLEGEKLALAEIFRFENGPLEIDGSLRWDFDELFSNVKTGIGMAMKAAGGRAEGIAVDSWGVDFGLVDSGGRLIENPYHYRDGRTDTMMEQAFRLIPKKRLYEITGLQFLQFNSIYQLLAYRLQGPEVLERADKMLFMADLVGYFLCGQAYAEYTLASTSQLLDAAGRCWSGEVLEKTQIPRRILPRIVNPGTVVGRLRGDICGELGCEPARVIAAASHDTAAAVAAVPAEGESWAYLSSGTWSLMGIESPVPIITDASFEQSFTNEGGVAGTIRFLKNIMGLWLLQECRRTWQQQGKEYSYDELTEMARKAEPFKARIDPNHGEFLAPGDMPGKINAHLRQTGQKEIAGHGQMARVILESLAFEYRCVMNVIEMITAKPVEVLHIVGGGTKNTLLCRFAASATGKRVVTGPVEATAAGNVLVQAMATGGVADLAGARRIVRNSFELRRYEPGEIDSWPVS